MVKAGARLHPLETLAMSFLPLALLWGPTRDLCLSNGKLQLAWFMAVVQLPALVTQRLSYVDIGWPCGLVLLALMVLLQGEGYWYRRLLAGGCLLIHGGRMGLGALVLFFPYKFKEDLPRYQYAKVRFLEQDGMPASLWWFKIQHDTLQQCFANIAVLACPFLLLASNKAPQLSPLEVAAGALWLGCWCLESWADGQMLLFRQACKQDQTKGAVIGRAPYDSSKYFLWTLCRHPNYFFEWMCWNSFVLMAVPSLLAYEGPFIIKVALAATLFSVSRLFYDCLLYWTGAEPAEYFSAKKRAEYRKHQEEVRVFFPVELPGVDHCRVAGWPQPEAK